MAEGLAPLMGWVKRLADHVIQDRMGHPDLEFAWLAASPADPAEQPKTLDLYVRDGIYRVNEARDVLGLAPVAGGDAALVYGTQGPVPLAAFSTAAPRGASAPSPAPAALHPLLHQRRGQGARATMHASKRSPSVAETMPLAKWEFDSDEPRIPAGNPDGGEWTTGDDDDSRNIGNDSGIWSGYEEVAWNGDYHQYLVQHFADITRATGGAAATEVPLIAIDGTAARADLIVKPIGSAEPFVIEIKTGMDWRLTPNQQRVYDMLPIGGHVTANKNDLEQLGLISGQPLPPIRILFVVTVGPGRDIRYGWWPPESP